MTSLPEPAQVFLQKTSWYSQFSQGLTTQRSTAKGEIIS